MPSGVFFACEIAHSQPSKVVEMNCLLWSRKCIALILHKNINWYKLEDCSVSNINEKLFS